MANYPSQVKERNELNLRLGIKSSLSQLRSVIASLYVIYVANDKKAQVTYSEESINGGLTTIKLDSNLAQLIDNRFHTTAEKVSSLVNKTPLFTAQLEALQVGMELFFHLAKINFVATGLSERTGSSRYQKKLTFATNMVLVDLYLSSHSDEDVSKLVFAWLKDQPCVSKLEEGLKMLLNTFTEETQFKIRDNNLDEIVFNQECVYNAILDEGEVISKDANEPVGPYRIYKSYVASGMHPYLKEEKQQFKLNETASFSDLENYAKLVNTALDITPRKTFIESEILPTSEKNVKNNVKLGTTLFTFDDPSKFVWECIKYFNKQDCLKELFESKWFARSGFYNNYYTINGCFVAKEDTEGGEFENIEIFNNVLINNNFEVRTQEQIDGFIEAINILFSGRYKILQEGDFEKATYRLIKTTPVEIKPKYLPYLTALKTKPFLLLAGISGTGKSRLVKELAFMTCPKKSRNTEDQCFYDFQDGVNPANYLLVEVKPNWHDSSELLGYYNALDGKYELTPFVRFAVDAMQHPDVPFFVCLDEMNLAPIEQYFAEYLSVLETRTKTKDTITSAALLDSKKFENIDIEKYEGSDAAVIEYLQENGLIIPSNLFVIGTVNMDDTTHQFSRKVIDRAFTIEMNGGDLMDMYSETNSNALKYTEDPLPLHVMQSNYVTACEAFDDIDIKPYVESIKLRVAELLNAVNGILKDTPFQVSYRVQNELILYIVSLIERANYPSDIEPIIKEATLAILLSKILPRIQGDDKLLGRGDKKDVFTELKNFVGNNLVISTQNGDTQVILYDSLLQQVNDKLDIMHKRLENSYFANFF